MTIYIVLFICLLLFTWMSNEQNQKRLFWFSALLVFLVFALRNENVGTDTFSYVQCWNNSSFLYRGKSVDIGFEFIMRLLRAVNTSNEFFMVSMALIFLCGLCCFIIKNSLYPIDSLLFFCISGTVFVFFLLYLAAMRQSVAMTFYLIGLSLYFDKDVSTTKKYLAFCCLAIAIAIHGSCAIVIPVLLLLPYIKLSKRNSIITLVVTYVVGSLGLFFLSSLLSYIDLGGSDFSKYQGYTQVMTFGMNESTGIFNMFLLPFNLILIYLIYYISDTQLNSWSFKLLYVGTILSNLMIDNLMWGRLLIYFLIVSVVVFPNLLRTVPCRYKNIVYILVIAVFLRKVIYVLINAPTLAVINDIHTEVPYETWLSW